jgi:hypothetical protein
MWQEVIKKDEEAYIMSRERNLDTVRPDEESVFGPWSSLSLSSRHGSSE